MKQFVVLLIVCSAFIVRSQDEHHVIEHLFEERSLTDFERRLGMSERHYLDSALSSNVNQFYQAFFDSIRTTVKNGHPIHESEMDNAYEALIDQVKNEVDFSKPLPPIPEPLPTPESSNCTQIGFEGGGFSGWDLSRGVVSGAAPFSFTPTGGVAPGVFHHIQSGGTDQVTGIPKVDPTGGAYSIMLGDSTGIGAQAAMLRRSFVVDANTAMFEYSYAVIFQTPLSHGPNNLPYFTVRIFDELGNTIPCGNYTVYADQANAPDFNVISGATNVLYKDWTKVITNLTPYLGQLVTIQFTAGDCGLGAHYGYAYVDANCGTGEITATQDTLCPGETSTLTAPDGAMNYFWNTGESAQSITVDSGGVYTCYLTPFQGSSCYFTLDYTIEELIGPDASFDSSMDTICMNESITFTDQSSIPPPESITGYAWDFGDGTSTTFGTGAITGVTGTTGSYLNPNHQYEADGEFSVELILTSSTGCESSFLDTIVVNTLPIVVAGPDTLLCDTSQITLSGVGADSYVWDQGVIDGVSFIQNAGEIITYTVTGTAANGCVNTDQVIVETAELPPVDAGLDQIICEGTSVTLSGSGAESYVWNNGINDNVPFTQAVGSINYTVIGTDTNGCINTDEVFVTVNPLPIVNAGPDQIVCEETPVVLNGNGSNTPTWANGFTNNTPFIQPVGTTTYFYYDTLSTGCFAADSLQIEVMPNPDVTALDTAVCFGESVTLNGEGAVSYDWTGGIVDGVPFVPAQTDAYTVTGTAANGCMDAETVIVTVYPNPVASFYAQDTVVTTEVPATTFINLTTGASSYEWDFGDGSEINTEYSPTHHFPNDYSSYYDIMLIAYSDQGCVDIAYQSILMDAEETVFVPNSFTPDDDEFNQFFLPILRGYDENDYTLYIYNRWGELIFESHDIAVGWNGTYGGQGFLVQDGTYTWKIEVGANNAAGKEVFMGHVTVIR